MPRKLQRRAAVAQSTSADSIPLITIFGYALLAKCMYFTLLCAALALYGNIPEATFQSALVRWPPTGAHVFLSHFATWDSAYYIQLSQQGYSQAGVSCAFYPMWPALVRVVAGLLPVPHWLIGLVLANLLSAACSPLLYRVVLRVWGSTAGFRTVVLMMTFPGALFFQFNYTESLFLFLTLLLWDCLSLGRHKCAAVAALILPLTRAIGLFAILPLLWYVFLGWTGRAALRMAPAECLKRFRPRAPWLLLMPVLGYSLYLFAMWMWTGNGFAGFVAQENWGVHTPSHLFDFPSFLYALVHPTTLHAFTGSFLDRAVFIGLLWSVLVSARTFWHHEPQLLIGYYWTGILPAMSGHFTSYLRFASCAFPCFVALSLLSMRPARNCIGARAFWAIVFLVFIPGHAFCLWRFVNYSWTG